MITQKDNKTATICKVIAITQSFFPNKNTTISKSDRGLYLFNDMSS